MDHAHAPLLIAGCICAALGLLNSTPVIVPPLLMPALLASEQRHPACPSIMSIPAFFACKHSVYKQADTGLKLRIRYDHISSYIQQAVPCVQKAPEAILLPAIIA